MSDKKPLTGRAGHHARKNPGDRLDPMPHVKAATKEQRESLRAYQDSPEVRAESRARAMQPGREIQGEFSDLEITDDEDRHPAEPGWHSPHEIVLDEGAPPNMTKGELDKILLDQERHPEKYQAPKPEPEPEPQTGEQPPPEPEAA